jgi:hypothetical protein
VSALSTWVTSLIWPTSSLAATRGAMFLPLAVAGKAKCSPSAWITLDTPAICAAAFAASPALWPATRTWTSPPHCAAAVTVFKVAPLIEALSCSAMTREVMNGSVFAVIPDLIRDP